MPVLGARICDKPEKLDRFKSDPDCNTMKQMLTNIPLIVAMLDREGNFLYANKTIPGLTMEDIAGKKVFDFIPEEDRETARTSLARALEKGEQVEYESRGIGPNGTISWYSTIFSPISEAESVIAVVKDITALRRSQDELATTQKDLEQARMMGELGNMAGGIAHDFNNILAAILGNMGYLQTLDLDNADAGTKDEIREIITDIIQASKRGSDLTKKILMFAKPQIGELEDINPNEIISETISLVRKTSLNKGIRYVTRFEETPNTIHGDKSQLHRAIFNIVFNAADAIADHGTITISTNNITIEGNPAMMIGVEDTGAGIAPEVIDNIFKPFFTTKGKAKGTGLGLSVTWGVVQSHKGKISVRSEIGKGTAFEMVFPAKRDSEPPRKVSVAPKPFTIPGKVLIIDDEEALRKVNKRLIEKMGSQTLLAGSGREGIELFDKHKEVVSLVILDLIMPDMNGDKVLSYIRSASKDVKVIICSGYSDDLTRQDLMKLGANIVMAKPYDPLTLSTTIRTVFGNP